MPNCTGSDKTCSHRRENATHRMEDIAPTARCRSLVRLIARDITSSEGVGPGEKDSASILSISLVKVGECLWNNTCSDYCKTDVTSAAWREFTLELKDSGDCIVYFK